MLALGYRCPSFVGMDAVHAAAEHFRSVYPQEGVGFITANGFVPVENCADNPEKEFSVRETDWIKHSPVLALLHSHPDGTFCPSSADIQYQEKTAVPWGIMVTDGEHTGDPVWFGDQVEIPSLIGRPFIHGVLDCYSLIRDAFRLGKDKLSSLPNDDERIYDWPYDPVRLMEQPRDVDWWQAGDAEQLYLYDRDFEKGGFEELFDVNRRNLGSVLRPGDVFLYKLYSKVANHAGLYIGNGLILHHVCGYPSERAPASLWALHAHKWLRFKG